MVRRALFVLMLAGLCGLLSAQAVSAKTVWLCRPGLQPDPCTPGLSTTVYSPRYERLGVRQPRQVRDPAIDCFYVYPTVSDQQTEYSNLKIEPEERSVALVQVARYSQYCRVFAPMYRQLTVPYLQRVGPGSPAALAVPYRDLLSAFREYLRRYSAGRGFVLIGHSQGAFVLRRLLAEKIDPNPKLRHRLVSAILLGGNVLVRSGSDIGGDFKHIPACTRPRQLHCVVAFSTFDQTPPANSFFGRAPAGSGDQVLCINPARLSASHGLLDPILPSKPFAPRTLTALTIKLLGVVLPKPKTVWSSAPGAYQARCSSAAGTDVLEITPLRGAPDPRPSPTPQWGLHLADASIALGNLVTVVARDGRVYAGRG